MSKQRILRLVGVFAIFALVLAACGEGEEPAVAPPAAEEEAPAEAPAEAPEEEPAEECPPADEGITDDTIRLGGTYPLSGPASAYGVIGSIGVDAYFEHVNEDLGGVNGRQIEYIFYDDEYSPPLAVERVRRLVERDGVFALFQNLGTPPVTATRDYANEVEVPQIFVATGATKWGLEHEEFPWTIGWQPDYRSEGYIYAEWLHNEHPGATVAILYQNDDYGEDVRGHFEEAIEVNNHDVEIIAQESYEVTDPTVESQMASLAASGADVFVNITTPRFTAQSIGILGQLAWEPLHIINNVGNATVVVTAAGADLVQGAITTLYVKDPSSPAFDDDPDMIEYKETLARFRPDADLDDGQIAYGWAVAQSLHAVLERMPCPTRESLMETVRNMDNIEVPMLMDGIVMSTSEAEGDYFPIQAMVMAEFEGEDWVPISDVIDTRE
jgi:branched-chain amino acid transport system substrate-binding protein